VQVQEALVQMQETLVPGRGAGQTRGAGIGVGRMRGVGRGVGRRLGRRRLMRSVGRMLRVLGRPLEQGRALVPVQEEVEEVACQQQQTAQLEQPV
jgi:hypothetical protein